MAFKRNDGYDGWLFDEDPKKKGNKKSYESYRKWTECELQFLRDNMLSTSLPVLCRQLNRTESAVRQKRVFLKKEMEIEKKCMGMTGMKTTENKNKSKNKEKLELKESTNKNKGDKSTNKEPQLNVMLHQRNRWTWKEVAQLFYFTTSLGFIAILGFLLLIK